MFRHMWLTKSHENHNLKLCFLTAGYAQYPIYAFKVPLSLFKSGVYTFNFKGNLEDELKKAWFRFSSDSPESQAAVSVPG